MKEHLSFLVVPLILGVSALSQAASLVGLGDLPGGNTSSQALSLSADGSTVVGKSSSSTGSEGFRWRSGAMEGLGYLSRATGKKSFANDVSADGMVVVGRSIGRAGYGAFRWTSGTGMIGLGDLWPRNPGVMSEAFGVSANGDVVVGQAQSRKNRIVGTEAFLWTVAGGMVGIGDLSGGAFFSKAYGVSADGSVIVGSSESAAGREAFRWTRAGGMVGLGDLAGGSHDSRALNISADGRVVVGRGSSAASAVDGQDEEAFRWTSTDGMVGLGDLDGGTFSSVASDVSSDGGVVVGRANDGTSTAFVWTELSGMVSLESLLIAKKVDLTGWIFVEANAVSDAGHWVAGWGTHDGKLEGFLANIGTVRVTARLSESNLDGARQLR